MSLRPRTSTIVWGYLTLLLISVPVVQADDGCVIRTYIQTPYGIQTTLALWNATFVDYLNHELSSTLGCSFELKPLVSIDNAYDVVKNNLTDFLLISAGQMHCIEIQSGISPIASLVNWAGGRETTVYGGCVFVRSNRTDITSLQHLTNASFAMGPFSDLPAFELQWLAQHINGISLLGSAFKIMFDKSSPQGIMDVLSGEADAALGRADILSDMQYAGQINASDLKCVTAQGNGMVPGYPYPMATSAWPEQALAAHPKVPQATRKAVAEALFRLTNLSHPAVVGDYSTWVPPYSYATIAQLEEKVGYIENGKCLRNATFKELLMCPAGQASNSLQDLTERCQKLGVSCPPAHICYCQPCHRITPSVYHRFGAVGATAFTIIVAVAPALSVIACVALGLYLCQMRTRNQQLLPKMIPFSELKITSDSPVLYSGENGLILKGCYCSINVAVKRLLPPSTPGYPSVFGKTVAENQKKLQGGKAGPKVRRLSAAKAKGCDSRPHSPLLASTDSQGALLANYSKTFIEQLRAASSPSRASSPYRASMPDSFSARGPTPARLFPAPFSQGSKSQCALIWLKRTVEKAWPWGAAAEYRRQRTLILRLVHERMQLRHPNICTIMGASAEPVTEDPLVVFFHTEHGTLKNLLHNETVQLDPEMLTAILKDVTMGLKYLHGHNPPLLEQDLAPGSVLLAGDYVAQLAHHEDLMQAGKMGRGEGIELEATTYCKAPELLKSGMFTTATDIYALGMVMYEILFRREPFAGEPTEEVLHALCDKNRKLPKRPSMVPPHGQSPPAELVALMQRCWHQDPEMRPSINDVKDELLRFAHTHFQSRTPAEALALKHAKERALLDQILPPKVSAALKEGRPVEPESVDCVTIFFSDVVGFQTYSVELSPQEVTSMLDRLYRAYDALTSRHNLFKVMSMLDRLYRAFDALTSRHNLFKVETIGDSYMVVGNLRCSQADHAARVAYFAIEAVQTAQSILVSESNPDLGHISIRAGFHSGPVVASVVGTTNPRYCLFGDTVNVASRMEGSSIANRIHITSAAAELVVLSAPELKHQLVHRRMQQIKGKGVMRTFWLELSPDHHLLGPPPDSPDNSAGTSRTNSQAAPIGRMSGLQTPIEASKRRSQEGGSNAGSRLSTVFTPPLVPDVMAQQDPSVSSSSGAIAAIWPQHTSDAQKEDRGSFL